MDDIVYYEDIPKTYNGALVERDSVENPLRRTTPRPYDQIVALTQAQVNMGLKNLYKGRRKSLDPLPMEVVYKTSKFTNLLIGSPQIIISSRYKNRVLYCLTLKSGTFESKKWERPGGEMVHYDVKMWRFFYPARLITKTLRKEDDQVKTIEQKLKSTQGSFTIQQLLLDLQGPEKSTPRPDEEFTDHGLWSEKDYSVTFDDKTVRPDAQKIGCARDWIREESWVQKNLDRLLESCLNKLNETGLVQLGIIVEKGQKDVSVKKAGMAPTLMPVSCKLQSFPRVDLKRTRTNSGGLIWRTYEQGLENEGKYNYLLYLQRTASPAEGFGGEEEPYTQSQQLDEGDDFFNGKQSIDLHSERDISPSGVIESDGPLDPCTPYMKTGQNWTESKDRIQPPRVDEGSFMISGNRFFGDFLLPRFDKINCLVKMDVTDLKVEVTDSGDAKCLATVSVGAGTQSVESDAMDKEYRMRPTSSLDWDQDPARPNIYTISYEPREYSPSRSYEWRYKDGTIETNAERSGVSIRGKTESSTSTTLSWTRDTNTMKWEGVSETTISFTTSGSRGISTNKCVCRATYSIDLTLQAVSDGGLEIAAKTQEPTLDFTGSAGDVEDIKSYLRSAFDKAGKNFKVLVGEFKDALAGQECFVFPAGGIYFFKNPLIDLEGNLFCEIGYNGNTKLEAPNPEAEPRSSATSLAFEAMPGALKVDNKIR